MSCTLSLLQILFALLYVSLPLVKCNEFFVHPANAAYLCPEEATCHDLAYYSNQSNFAFTSNTIFSFLNGTHVLDERESLVFNSTNNLTLRGLGEIVPSFDGNSQSTVQIICENWAGGFFFVDSINITLDSITISDCGGIETIYHVSLGFLNVDNVNLIQIAVLNSSGIGLLVVDGFDVFLSASVLAFNNYDSYTDMECLLLRDHERCSGGNALFLYTRNEDDECGAEQPIYSLSIINSNFSYGVNLLSGGTGGISISLTQGSAYGVDVILDNVIVYNNVGMNGANIRFTTLTSVVYHTLTINNSFIFWGNLIDFDYPFLEYDTNFRSVGGGLLYDVGVLLQTEENPCPISPPDTLLSIAYTVFYANYGAIGGGVAFFALSEETSSQNITIHNCTFFRNIGLIGMGMYFDRYEYLTYYTQLKFNFSTVLVTESISLFDYHYSTSSAIYMFTLEDTVFSNFEVSDHNTCGIVLVNSVLTIAGFNNLLFNNHGINGGGLALHGNSFLVLDSPASLNMSNNSAEKGGAIFVENSFGEFLRHCFFQLTSIMFLARNVILFENNVAKDSGSVLYGGNVDSCLLYDTNTLKVENSAILFDKVFSFNNQTGLSVISSDPTEVCFCHEDKPDCAIKNQTLSTLPGDSAVINLVAVGQRHGISPGFVRVAEETNEDFVLKHFAYDLPAQCSDQFYTVVANSSNETMIKLTLTVNQRNSKVIDHNHEEVKLVFISVQACPLGFELVNGVCGCGENIRSSGSTLLNCYPDTQEIQRQGEVWIAYDNSTQCIVVNPSCPFDYCNAEAVTFTLTAPDAQCSLNRSGTLCGQCADGLSLLLGSNRCDYCHNGYLALILPFAAAGIVLIVFLIALNLTVSVGAINGLIFYANVIKINETIFFPNGPIPFLSQFIAWINLDLGIQTCFFYGMTGYSKIWMQFVFPFYIWFLILVIIFICRYSVRLSQLVGGHVVPVLATLFLLSYTKLIRIIVAILQKTAIPCGSATLPLAWLIDPNIEYFSMSHLILFMFANFVLVFLAFPYTFLLLLGPVLEKHLPRSKRLRPVIIKLKPILDAYNGPCKDKLRFWTGLLLLARLAIVLVESLDSNIETNIMAVITTTTILLALTTCCGGVYQKTYLNILESWFMLNLVILATISVTQYDVNTSSKISVSLVFLTFLVILLYHVVLRWKGQNYIDSHLSKCLNRNKSSSESVGHGEFELEYDPSIHEAQSTHTELQIMKRETLIMYGSEDDISTRYIRVNVD